MHACDPQTRLAAVLTAHWQAGDIEAVVLLLAEEIGSQQEAEDVLVALLMIRDKPMEEITRIIRMTSVS